MKPFQMTQGNLDRDLYAKIINCGYGIIVLLIYHVRLCSHLGLTVMSKSVRPKDLTDKI